MNEPIYVITMNYFNGTFNFVHYNNINEVKAKQYFEDYQNDPKITQLYLYKTHNPNFATDNKGQKLICQWRRKCEN